MAVRSPDDLHAELLKRAQSLSRKLTVLVVTVALLSALGVCTSPSATWAPAATSSGGSSASRAGSRSSAPSAPSSRRVSRSRSACSSRASAPGPRSDEAARPAQRRARLPRRDVRSPRGPSSRRGSPTAPVIEPAGRSGCVQPGEDDDATRPSEGEDASARVRRASRRETSCPVSHPICRSHGRWEMGRYKPRRIHHRIVGIVVGEDLSPGFKSRRAELRPPRTRARPALAPPQR